MGKASKAFGALLILSAVACFLVNFKIWNPWLLANLPYFWNPLSYFTPKIVGNVPIISGSIGYVLNYIFALVYSAVLFVIGAFALMH
jgi:hypothetical protein